MINAKTIYLGPLSLNFFKYMAWSAYKGVFKLKHFPKTASTALANNSLVSLSSGQLIQGTTTSTQHEGVLQRAVVSGDSDYGSTTRLPVQSPGNAGSLYVVDVTNGTLTTAMVGGLYDAYTSGLGLNVSAQSHKIAKVAEFQSASKAIAQLNSYIGYANAS